MKGGFRFYCQKVLPLVYDDSLSYYELLCKLIDRINGQGEDISGIVDELINLRAMLENTDSRIDIIVTHRLDEMVEDGTLAEIVQSIVLEKPFNTVAGLEVYAQVIANKYVNFEKASFQGIAMGNVGGIPVCMVSVIDNAEASTTENGAVISFNMNNGLMLGKYEGSIQHGTCITFNEDEGLFILCGGHSRVTEESKIFKFDYLCRLVSQKTLANYKYGYISWNNGFYYCTLLKWDDPDFWKIAKCDENFGVITSVDATNVSHARNGFFVDNDFIYSVDGDDDEHGVAWRVNVYYKDNLKFKQTVYLDTVKEVEDGCFYDGECYVMTNLAECGFIYKLNLRSDGGRNNYYRSSIKHGHPSVTLSDAYHMYVDGTYAGFLCNNTEDKPYADLVNAIADAEWIKGDSLVYHILGDCVGSADVRLKGDMRNVQIIGTDDYPKISSLVTDDMYFLTVSKVTLNNESTKALSTHTTCRGGEVIFDDCVFENVASRNINVGNIYLDRGVFTIRNSTFVNSSPSERVRGRYGAIVTLRNNKYYDKTFYLPNRNNFINEFENLDLRKNIILALGDSFCYGVRNNYRGVVGNLSEKGYRYWNKGVSGMSISASPADEGDGLCEQIDAITNEIYTGELRPDFVVLTGGINDYIKGRNLGVVPPYPYISQNQLSGADKHTLLGAMCWVDHYVSARFPYAQKIFVIQHKMTYRAGTRPELTNKYLPITNNSASVPYTQTEMVEGIKKACDVLGWTVVDVFNDSFMNSRWTGQAYLIDADDGVHPTRAGYDAVYTPMLEQKMYQPVTSNERWE